MSLRKLEQIKQFHSLPEDRRQWLAHVAESHGFSMQQLRLMVEYSLDLVCWDQGSLEPFYAPREVEHLTGKQAPARIFKQLQDGYEGVKNGLKAYPSPDQGRFTAAEGKFPREQMVETDLKGAIMGKCPVASEKTRCCNLNTLDAVQQCGFDCSYCSIQSFYHGNQVRFVRDLAQHLEGLELDKETPMHIGTGQSSDSLMWGNRFGLLDNLTRFAQRHPNVVLEMKSKSSRIDYFIETPPPANMVFTWSLNPPEVIAAEEKGTAPLEKRLESARRLADQGVPVGFHFHPMVWYQGWETAYRSIVSQLESMFSPREVVMVSMGTLTFIKPVMKRIRERMAKTSILQMPMEECAGKLSYPFEIKKQLFSHLYRGFSKAWQDSVFFYMCMEDIALWEPVFGRSYGTNEAFEQDMLQTYMEKIQALGRDSSS
ncbi:MAG: DNA photolyase [Desulfobacterales bacterium]|nr:DNA photolyase [Desulfobacterales bacterium]